MQKLWLISNNYHHQNSQSYRSLLTLHFVIHHTLFTIIIFIYHQLIHLYYFDIDVGVYYLKCMAEIKKTFLLAGCGTIRKITRVIMMCVCMCVTLLLALCMIVTLVTDIPSS